MPSHPSTIPKKSHIFGLGLTALLSPAFPLVALATQHHNLSSGTTLHVNVENIEINTDTLVPTYLITTPLHHLSTSRLTGDNDFIANDKVFVYLSAGPENIWYPYALSKRPADPAQHSETILVLAGQVSDVYRDSLKVGYDFDTIPVSNQLKSIDFANNENDIKIQIDDHGRSTLKILKIGETVIDQRNLLKLAP